MLLLVGLVVALALAWIGWSLGRDAGPSPPAAGRQSPGTSKGIEAAALPVPEGPGTRSPRDGAPAVVGQQPSDPGDVSGPVDDERSAALLLRGTVTMNGVPVMGGSVLQARRTVAGNGQPVPISAIGTLELPLEAQPGPVHLIVQTEAFPSAGADPIAVRVPQLQRVRAADLEPPPGGGPAVIDRVFALDVAFVDVTVRDERGAPVAGARVRCRGTLRPGRDHRADDAGRFLHAVWVVGPATSSVSVSATGFADAGATVPLDPGALEQTVEITLRREVPCAGTWSGLRSLLEDREHVRWQFWRDGEMTGFCTMPEGERFSLDGFVAGRYRIDVTAKSRLTHRAELDVPPGGGTELRLDFLPLAAGR